MVDRSLILVGELAAHPAGAKGVNAEHVSDDEALHAHLLGHDA